jgi:hypothetical protein
MQAISTRVKKWGPISNNRILGIWHHISFTVRFARVTSTQGSEPMVIITQAHMFLDSERMDAGDSFLSIDIEAELTLETGISNFYIGGVSPSTSNAVSFQNFVGSMDNVRLWWPSCPSEDDPSR